MSLIFVGVAGQPNPIISMVPVLLMFVIFYFLLIRPQQKQQKEHKAFLRNLDKNQEVVTTSGIHGTVVQVKDATVTLRVAENVRLEFDKVSIAHLQKAVS